ncbi:translocation protein TolB [bacterium BMS3Bbin03]|nr:translocation protein TolB [bacterium BMS3Bbin03]
MKLFFTKIVLIAILFMPSSVFPQMFGQNKVRHQLKWQVLYTPHFRIYFYNKSEFLTNFVAAVAESSYASLSRELNYKLANPIPIVFYKSHADFEETTVSPQIQPESTGGFTEMLRDRVVIPYEGSWEELRHVIHHELTHAVTREFFYGGRFGAAFSGISKLRWPLWFAEGLAEYESLGWNANAAMYVRDAIIFNYLSPIPDLRGYMVYKGGQSIYNYLQNRYGREKIREILWKVNSDRNVVKGFEDALNQSLTEFSDQWHTYEETLWWPEIKRRTETPNYAQKLSNHLKWQNAINNSPSLSPNGEEIAFLSNKGYYFDIYLMSSTNGKIIKKLVSGQRNKELEEMHFLKPGIAWSPDGKFIAFAAKGNYRDKLYILNVRKSKIVNKYDFHLDGLYSPAWSPDGKKIAFSGFKDGLSDIYVFHLDTKSLTKATNDIFSDASPTWAPDSKTIAFVSDRQQYIYPDHKPPKDFKVYDFNYRYTNIYTVSIDGAVMRQITDTPYINDKSPAWSKDGRDIAFVSDRNGIFNIYLKDLEKDTTWVMSNLLTGADQLSWISDLHRLAFTSYYHGGYDIYLKRDFIAEKDRHPKLTPIPTNNEIHSKISPEDLNKNVPFVVQNIRRMSNAFRSFVFDEDFKNGNVPQWKLPNPLKKKAAQKNVIKPYRIKFMPNVVTANAGYDQWYGLQGLTQLSFSDLLGGHQINIQADLLYSISNSTFVINYVYLPRRVQLSAGLYHYPYFIWSKLGLYRFRNYGMTANFLYPFSRFKRIQLGINFLNITVKNLDYPNISKFSTKRSLIFQLSRVTDNSVWGAVGPIAGSRTNLSLISSPPISKNSLTTYAVMGDFRKYFLLGKNHTFASRLSFGESWGKDKQHFFLGGVSNWINGNFYRYMPATSISDYYFSHFVTPLRGYDYYAKTGTGYALVNLEYRFPLIHYLVFGIPSVWGLSQIRGVSFLDIGSAWNRPKDFRGIVKSASGKPQFKDIAMGYGVGARFYFYYFLIRFDVAWNTNLIQKNGPIIYWSLGTNF